MSTLRQTYLTSQFTSLLKRGALFCSDLMWLRPRSKKSSSTKLQSQKKSGHPAMITVIHCAIAIIAHCAKLGRRSMTSTGMISPPAPRVPAPRRTWVSFLNGMGGMPGPGRTSGRTSPICRVWIRGPNLEQRGRNRIMWKDMYIWDYIYI